MSIKIKLLLSISISMAVVGCFTVSFIYQQNKEKLTQHFIIDAKNITSYSFQLTNFYFNQAEETITSLANNYLFLEALEASSTEKLSGVFGEMAAANKSSNIIENITLQRIVGDKCILVAADNSVQDQIGKDFSNKDYCKGIIEAKKSYLSSAYISEIYKKPVLEVVVPIKKNTGEMIGFVSGSISLERLMNYFTDLQNDSSVSIIDRYGNLFFGSKEQITSLATIKEKRFTTVDLVRLKLESGILESYFKETDRFVGYKNTKEFTIIYEKSTNAFSALIKNLNLIVFYSILIAVILVFLIIILFVERFVQRIKRLSEVSKQISNMNFDVKVEKKDLEKSDEIGILTRSFMNMSSKLAGYYGKLEAEVKKRTIEIEEKNQKLAMADDELKKALETAENINKLMIGRELKMIELKQKLLEKNKQ